MITEIKNIVDVLTFVMRSTKAHRQSSKRKELFADLLEAYFHFAALQRNGTMLLDLGGSDPVAKVTGMAVQNVRAYAEVCHRLIAEQQWRLHRLNSLIQQQAVLDVFGSGFRDRVDEIVGTKEKGLLGAAASIQFYFLFGPMLARQEDIKAHGEEIAGYMYQARIAATINETDHESDVIDLTLARENLAALASAAEELRKIIVEQCEQETLLEVTSLAESRASFPPKAPAKA